ncbi:MAG TPA: hypothetical protein VII10_02955 [Reyranella sp.]|jgi:hypothetical protein
MTVAILVVPSVTKLPPEANGAVIVGGSHAAAYAAHVVAKAGARAAIHHDAGIGFEEAGVAGLALAQELGMAMAAVDSASARIGEAEDMMRRGIVSRTNALAAACGVAPGQSCAEAAERLRAAPWPHRAPPVRAEGRSVFEAKAGQRRIVCIDSATLITDEDRDQVAATGSHGAEASGQVVAPVQPALVLYNDAGFGADRAGVAGLLILEKAGVAGATVAALSAKIGDGRSTLTRGVLSAVNEAAYRLGGRVGGSALALARLVAEKAG